MLLVKTSVKPSSIEGLGLFAEEKIPKGASVWKYDSRFDIALDLKEVEAMEPLRKEFINRYAYLSPESGKYILCMDDARFMNHSSVKDNLNTTAFPGELETRGVANQDIKIGEEILINYRAIDAADAISTDAYLAN